MPKKKNTKEGEQKQKTREKVKAQFVGDRIITECSEQANDFYESSRFGKLLSTNKLQLSLVEASYLLEKERIEVLDGRNKPIEIEKFGPRR